MPLLTHLPSRNQIHNQPNNRINSLKFVPGLMSSLITLLLLPLFVYLGSWQLHRMTEKEKLEHRLIEANPIPIEGQDSKLNIEHDVKHDIEHDIDRYRYRTLHLQGQFLNEKNILLDNQTFKGQVGYRVFTPFLPRGSQKILLIDRGWVASQGRSKLPQIASITGPVDLIGVLNKFSQGITLKKEAPPEQIDPGLIRVQSLSSETLIALADLLNEKIHLCMLQLPHDSPYVYIATPVNLGMSSLRHLGYAVQWFTMAAVTLIYYLVISIKRGQSNAGS